MKKNNTCIAQTKEKVARYAQTAPRTPMPRPTVYESKKTYNRQRNKKELSNQINE